MSVVDFEKFKREKQGEPVHTGVLVSKPAQMGRERLIKASRDLHEAMLRQGEDANQFRQSVSDLKFQIERLEKTVKRFDDKVRRIRIRPLRHASNRLCGIMDSYLATQTP